MEGHASTEEEHSQHPPPPFSFLLLPPETGPSVWRREQPAATREGIC